MLKPSQRLALSAALVLGGVILAGPPAMASRPGDAHRFDTWVGYEVGRFVTTAAPADFDGDGDVDVAWGRDDFFDNSLSITFNLGDGTLGNPITYPVEANTSGIAPADLDGDGDMDIAVSAGNTGNGNKTIDILLNNGSGVFVQSTLTAGVGPEAIAAGDFDSDGDVDLVVPNSNFYDGTGQGSISVMLSRGDGTFDDEVRYPTGYAPEDVGVADLDGDGVLDVLSMRNDNEANRYAFELLHGNGDGTFLPDAIPQLIEIPTNGGALKGSFALGDVDADGDVDAFANGFATFNNAILENDGTGTFTTTLYDVFGTSSPLLADIDGDGDLDAESVDLIGSAYVQRNNGDGTLAAPERLPTSNDPYGIGIADVDADGRVDLLIANRSTELGSVHLQRPDGTFAAPVNAGPFATAVDLAPGDLDGDSDVDVAATGILEFQDVVRVLLNDGTGVLTEGSVVRWADERNVNGRSVSTGDIDADGDIDLAWLVNQGSNQRVLTAANNGAGTFAAPVPHVMATCSDKLTLADADGDGALDLLLGNESSGCSAPGDTISIAYNSGTGTFGAAQLVTLAPSTRSIVVADVDLDGQPDLVGGGASFGADGDIAVAYGAGGRTFPELAYTTTNLDNIELIGADFDADGDPDIASNTSDQGTSVLINDGTGAFSHRVLPGENIFGYRNTVGIAAGDVNGDTVPDLLIANETGSNIGVHAGNGDGTFEQNQVRYGMRPRVSDVKAADLDGDGVQDILSTAQVPPSGAQAESADGGTQARPPAGVAVLLSTPPACTITGTEGDDDLFGTDGADVICGLGGDDKLRGLGSGDVLMGGPGNDKIVGGTGDDVVDGGRGRDAAAGGPGVDRLRGAGGADRLVGGPGSDVLDGLDLREGNDRVEGSQGADHCRADDGDAVTGCP